KSPLKKLRSASSRLRAHSKKFASHFSPERSTSTSTIRAISPKTIHFSTGATERHISDRVCETGGDSDEFDSPSSAFSRDLSPSLPSPFALPLSRPALSLLPLSPPLSLSLPPPLSLPLSLSPPLSLSRSLPPLLSLSPAAFASSLAFLPS